ncbi:MAG: type II toxin-antitoxin system HicB family antitoxin [Nitrospirae bacterium]|nr:type II toxin-antitoxin system HicB family antitoxin [Nitrospirota bacterium]MBF0534896.1 type II toxin-antitoxin system HicB family antitoxin [Nitrospirota bacterium]MBF0616811.1 type II toxin-antitoxin system HicB family antitoxin [Nitrospirota bacterium]
MNKYLIVIEKSENNFSAYSPDLLGCVATGKTQKDVIKNMHRAIEMHIEGLREDGIPIPEPQTCVDYIEF